MSKPNEMKELRFEEIKSKYKINVETFSNRNDQGKIKVSDKILSQKVNQELLQFILLKGFDGKESCYDANFQNINFRDIKFKFQGTKLTKTDKAQEIVQDFNLLRTSFNECNFEKVDFNSYKKDEFDTLFFQNCEFKNCTFPQEINNPQNQELLKIFRNCTFQDNNLELQTIKNINIYNVLEKILLKQASQKTDLTDMIEAIKEEVVKELQEQKVTKEDLEKFLKSQDIDLKDEIDLLKNSRPSSSTTNINNTAPQQLNNNSNNVIKGSIPV